MHTAALKKHNEPDSRIDAIKGMDAIADNIRDAYAFSDEEAANPAAFGFTNITTPSCNLTAAVNPLGSSLVCTTSTLVSGAEPTWAFADTVHPTPYSYALLADRVFASLLLKGWN